MRNTQHIPAYLVGLLITVCLLQACNGCNNNNDRPAASTITYQDSTTNTSLPPITEKDTLRGWAEQRLIRWKGWLDSSLSRPFTIDSLSRVTVDTIPATDTIVMEDSLFEDYKSFFVYSPDSTQVVDMVSYGTILHKGHNGKVVLEGGDPDMEVAIVNVQTKKRERILFCGPSTFVKEVVWINDHTVLIAGGTYDENNQLQPAIWKYDTVQHLLENWEQDDVL